MGNIDELKRKIKAALVLLLTFTGASAQQTLFSVPDGDVTGRNTLSFQQSVQITDKLESETTFSLGLGRGWELGLNAMNITVHTDPGTRVIRLREEDPADNPQLYFNIRKSFDLTARLKLSGGTRLGSTIASTRGMRFANFSYANTELCWKEGKGKIVGGGYFTNEGYSGLKDHYGYMAGVQLPFLKIFNLKADYISGRSEISYLTLGGGLFLPRKWELAAGVQLPSSGSPNPVAATIKLSHR